MDYTTTEALAQELAGLFWAAIERINPAQRDLRLSQATYEQWRAEISVLPDGRPRKNFDGTCSWRSAPSTSTCRAGRSPSRNGGPAGRCPARSATASSRAPARRRRVSERMADRTRQRQPLLPAARRVRRPATTATCKPAGRDAGQAAPGQEFTHHGRTYRRTNSRHDQRPGASRRHQARPGHRPGRRPHLQRRPGRGPGVLGVGDRGNPAALRRPHRGTARADPSQHPAVPAPQRRGRRPAGDRPVQDRPRTRHPHVRRAVRRHRRDHPPPPAHGSRRSRSCRATTSTSGSGASPMPFLFQRKLGTSRAVLSTHTVQRMLQRPCLALAQTRPEFAGLTFTPHDFRRLFATELVNNGLPIHIGAALLGHLICRQPAATSPSSTKTSSATTRHSSTGGARCARPTNTGRPPTPSGPSSRSTSTSARSNWAAAAAPTAPPASTSIRLHPLPRPAGRPQDAGPAGRDRSRPAQPAGNAPHAEGWRGEIEGLDLTLSFLREQASTHPAVHPPGPAGPARQPPAAAMNTASSSAGGENHCRDSASGRPSPRRVTALGCQGLAELPADSALPVDAWFLSG